MQTGITLQEFAKKLADNKKHKRDFIVDTKALTMVKERDDVALRFKDPEVRPLITTPIMDIAHHQIAGRLSIPRAYYERMRTSDPELLATNVNHWLRDEPEKRMIRTLRGSTRAFLSSRYNRIENEEIAEITLPILQRIKGCRIISCEVTDRRMYIQAVNERVEGKVKKGDVVQAGVAISNSEVGRGAVKVNPLVLVLRCLNGMVIPDASFRAFHVGRNVEDSEELWADDTRAADDRAILLKVRDMVEAAVDATIFNKRVDAMKECADTKVTGDPAVAVELLGKKVGVSDEEGAGILRALIEGHDLSAWGLINAVTRQAHTAKSYDRSVEFEAAGGDLLAMSASEWRPILKAA